ncbi:arylphorin subunit C223-like [Lucilia sericata]|uniref:arylphorin subunit C223-like n=1 Tax=Lucilia sericata TaxID=13632 RepID=UPI0018A841AF|nr:arylphorin subunit C223-like [Lucilia sericata]
MKIAIILLAIAGLVNGSSSNSNQKFLNKQKFLLEIVYRVEEPLMFEEWIKLGKTFNFDRSEYTRIPHYMEKYCKALKFGATLPKSEYFGALTESHIQQAYGLFGFFYYVKTWELFQRNVAWARMFSNEATFVYALNLVLLHRDDLKGLLLPSIYEIFPQNFFNSKFIYAAEKFDYETWSQYIMYEKQYKDILYEDYAKVYKPYDRHFYYRYTTDWKLWQWWKMMGLGDHWYSEEHFIMRENWPEYYEDPKFFEIYDSTHMFFMPVDYTRNIELNNLESTLSFLTEDVGLNAYWYYLNLNLALDGKHNYHRDQFWLYNLEQILRRYRMERLSHGLEEILDFSFLDSSDSDYDSHLISYNGISYTNRKFYYELEQFGHTDYYQSRLGMFDRLEDIISKSFFETYAGETIDLLKPVNTVFKGNTKQGKVDTFDKYTFQYWYQYTHMYFAKSNSDDYEVLPNAFLNYETMMRDPMFYSFHKKIASVFYDFRSNIAPYTHDELLFPNVIIKDVEVSELVTYFDLVDFDVSNLINDKVNFVDDQMIWDKTLLARQMRLNHKPFEFVFSVESDKTHKAVVRTFLGPKYDQFGRVITLPKNRENFMEIDSFFYTLKAGNNIFIRKSDDFSWTAKDRISYTELYKLLMLAIEGKYEFPTNLTKPQCAFPDRLLLPRGWPQGMPMQLFFFITPLKAKYDNNSTFDYAYSCGIGSGIPYNAEIAFGYPFDREIIEYEFFVPNMLFKDVKIGHKDTFEKYFEHKYEHFGQFDYEYL